jgi:FkbM family methyltransferase
MPLTPDEKTIFDLCLPKLPHDAVLFDVGAYKGEWTEYAKGKLPDAGGYLFEANKELCDDLVKRGYWCLNVAVSDATGNKVFLQCAGNADEMSSVYSRSVFSEIHVVPHNVKSITIDGFCSGNRDRVIDFLKIDVEGAEFDVLKGCVYMLYEKRIRFIQVEYGGTYPDAGITFKEVIKFVNDYGYSVYELKDGSFHLVTLENFVEDYRFANFLVTTYPMDNATH